MSMRNATRVGTETSKVPTRVTLLFIFYSVVRGINKHFLFPIRFTNELITKLKQEIRSKLSPRHIPAKILQTQDIPHTTNGKKVEVAVKRILAGEIVEHRVAYRNPESLDLYYNLKELEDL